MAQLEIAWRGDSYRAGDVLDVAPLIMAVLGDHRVERPGAVGIGRSLLGLADQLVVKVVGGVHRILRVRAKRVGNEYEAPVPVVPEVRGRPALRPGAVGIGEYLLGHAVQVVVLILGAVVGITHRCPESAIGDVLKTSVGIVAEAGQRRRKPAVRPVRIGEHLAGLASHRVVPVVRDVTTAVGRGDHPTTPVVGGAEKAAVGREGSDAAVAGVVDVPGDAAQLVRGGNQVARPIVRVGLAGAVRVDDPDQPPHPVVDEFRLALVGRDRRIRAGDEVAQPVVAELEDGAEQRPGTIGVGRLLRKPAVEKIVAVLGDLRRATRRVAVAIAIVRLACARNRPRVVVRELLRDPGVAFQMGNASGHLAGGVVDVLRQVVIRRIRGSGALGQGYRLGSAAVLGRIRVFGDVAQGVLDLPKTALLAAAIFVVAVFGHLVVERITRIALPRDRLDVGVIGVRERRDVTVSLGQLRQVPVGVVLVVLGPAKLVGCRLAE